MNQTATQSLTTLEPKTDTRTSTNSHFFSALPPVDTATIPTFAELLAQYQATVSKPAVAWSDLSPDESATPFAIPQTDRASANPQSVRWLWQKCLPLAGFTILDGDHGCGKSLLALQIAACISSGSPLPDGSPTFPGGVVIVSPHNDATTTQLLTAMGADLSHIEILSSLQEPAPSSHAAGTRPFSIPEDLSYLFKAVNRAKARLVILDPFISLLSRNSRWNDQRLASLLADLKSHLIEHNIACLLIRNCHAKGGHARPSVLERSDHFETLAVSRLLLAPDPLQPDRLLLSHVTNRHGRLTPTLTLQIQPRTDNPDLPHMTILGSHSLIAKDFLNYRPDTLHRQLLFQHLLQIITEALDPMPVATLHKLSPHSSPSQIQRSLSDLLHMGQIQSPIRGFYTRASTTPTPSSNSSATTTSITTHPTKLSSSATITSDSTPPTKLNSSAATTPDSLPPTKLSSSATITSDSLPPTKLNSSAAITPDSTPPTKLNSSAAITSITPPPTKLNSSAAIQQFAERLTPHLLCAVRSSIFSWRSRLPRTAVTSITPPPTKLNSSAAITSDSTHPTKLNSSATTTSDSTPPTKLNSSAAITSDSSPTNKLNSSAAITPDSTPPTKLNSSAATTSDSTPPTKLNSSATTTSDPSPTNKLNSSAAITPDSPPPTKLNSSAATTSDPSPTNKLNSPATTASDSSPTNKLNSSATTTSGSPPPTKLNSSATTTLKASAPKRPHKKGRAKQRNTKKKALKNNKTLSTFTYCFRETTKRKSCQSAAPKPKKFLECT